ncbi:transposase [Rhodococcus opacus PD630]|nr:transposase [Rhodococcus opacus PD630]
MWRNPATDRRVAVWAFAIILSCSRMLFVQPVLRMDQSSWCASHVAAFEFFGGTPARIVCDNLKTGVDRPDLYDPKINRAYAELAAYYRVLIDPPAPENQRINPGSSARCPISATRTSRAASHLTGADAGRRPGLVHRRLRAPQSPWSRRCATRGGVRRNRKAQSHSTSSETVRAGPLSGREGRPGLSRQGRQGPVFGALAADRPAGAGPHLRRRGADLPHRAGGRHACAAPVGAVDEPRALPAAQDRLHAADRGLVSGAGRADRSRRRRGRRRVVAGQRAAPAAGDPGHRPAAGPLRRRPPGRGLRPRPRGR